MRNRIANRRRKELIQQAILISEGPVKRVSNIKTGLDYLVCFEFNGAKNYAASRDRLAAFQFALEMLKNLERETISKSMY